MAGSGRSGYEWKDWHVAAVGQCVADKADITALEGFNIFSRLQVVARRCLLPVSDNYAASRLVARLRKPRGRLVFRANAFRKGNVIPASRCAPMPLSRHKD